MAHPTSPDRHPPLQPGWVDTPHRRCALGDLVLESGERILDFEASYVVHGPDDPSLPLTFDWLIIEAALESLRDGDARPSAEDPLVQLRGSQRGAGQIPTGRRDLYD